MSTHFLIRSSLGAAFLALGAVLACSGASAKTSAANKSDELHSGWVLNLSSNYAGTVLSYITPGAAKMKLDKLELIILTKAPDWHYLVYNQSNKSYIDLSPDQFEKKFFRAKFKNAAGQSDRKFVPTKRTEMIAGVKAYDYIVKRKDRSGIAYETEGEFWIAPDVAPPAQFNRILEKLLNVPECKISELRKKEGMPLRVTSKQNNGKLVQVLECYKATKTAIKATEFQPLTNYHKVKDEMALMLDEDDAKDLTDGLGGDQLDGVKPAPLKSSKTRQGAK